jgi:hypothetical protein
LSQFEIIGTPAMRVFKRYLMPFSAISVSRTTLSNVEGEWAVRNFQINVCSTMCCEENGDNIIILFCLPLFHNTDGKNVSRMSVHTTINQNGLARGIAPGWRR